MRPKAIDLFCGAGGMSLGFEQAGFDIVLGVDRDGYHCAAHERNFPYGKTLCASVDTLSGSRIRELVGLHEIDLVFGGPPCQGFSTMGKRDSGDPRNSLVGEFVRIVKELRPRGFVMENVPGMQLGSTKVYFDYVVQTLGEAGYTITLPVRTLIATEFGAPQVRERLFVLGVRSDLGSKASYPRRALPGQPVARNVSEALQGLPAVDHFQCLFSEDAIVFQPSPDEVEASYARALAGVTRDPTDLSYPRISQSARIFGNKLSRHSPESIALYAATRPGAMVPGHKLPRLDPKGFAPTLRAGTESERGSHTAPRPIHPSSPRCITVREAARLHGYPDWFAFYPKVHHGFRQVGNSVSPFVARAVGYEMARALGYENQQDLLPSGAVGLTDEFKLPEERKKQEKRISHVNEFPKVIDYLFARFSGDGDADFSFKDIESAIRATEANMPRIRPESFLSEFARGRNAKAIMRNPMEKGYSVIATPQGGRFVPAGTPGSIGAEASIGFTSGDMRQAVSIKARPGTFGVEKCFEVLGSAPIVTVLGNIHRQSDLFSKNSDAVQKVTLKSPTLSKAAIFCAIKKGSSLNFDKAQSLAKKAGVDIVIAGFNLTEKHLGIAAVSFEGSLPTVLLKIVCLLQQEREGVSEAAA